MERKSEVVEFRDGSKLTVTEANWAISLKMQDLMEDAEKHPKEDLSAQAFNSFMWPRLFACSTGDVPNFEAALELPESELNVWFFAVRRVNPDWFPTEEDLKLSITEKHEKKGRKRTGSTPA